MLLFPHADKVADGSASAVLSGFNTTAVSGSPTGVTLVAGPAASAVFDSAAAGSNIGITYSGYSLAGADSNHVNRPIVSHISTVFA
ncbi:MAG: YDG domain-containing protein [Allosphingosinicella sp.]